MAQNSIVIRTIAETDPGGLSSSPPSLRPSTRALLNHFKPVEASDDFEIGKSHLLAQQEPDVLEIRLGLPTPSSMATENGLLQGSVNSNPNNSTPVAPIAHSARMQRRKRKPRKAQNEGDEPSTRSRKRRRNRRRVILLAF